MRRERTEGMKLRPLHLPPHEVRVLDNGLTLHVVKRSSLPLVAVRLVVRAGSAFDLPGERGVADFASRLLRRGAAGKSADEISEAVDLVGAALGGYANEENVVVSLSTPSRHLEAMLGILGQIVREPDFPEQEVELARRRTLAQLANELDDPGTLADRALSRAVWGHHPYAFESSGGKADVERLTRAQLVAFHRERFGPKVAHLFVVGDVDVEGVTEVIQRTLGGWAGGPPFAPEVPAWSGLEKPGEVVIVDKPEQTQVQLRIGAKGVRRGHPDHFPLVVMNAVLGGGFTSRLVTEIRVKRGLSYGAGSAFDMLSAGGSFTVSSFTRTESINTLIDVALTEVERMRAKGPSAKELATVQRYICGLYPGRLETNEAVAGAIADVVHYGLPQDWIASYRERISEVTVRQAAEAAQKYLFTGDRVLALVGNAEALKPLVSRYGPITVLRPTDLE
ncbi:MAG: pitrilysin family protein [Myxococcota bacterium]